MAMKERTGRSRVSKADEVVNKVNAPEPAAPVHSRVRPSSKTDEIGKKIPVETHSPVERPTRVRPASKADEIGRKIPTPKPAAERLVDPVPPQPSSRVIPPQAPAAKKKSGCCLLPFTLAAAGIIAALVVIF